MAECVGDAALATTKVVLLITHLGGYAVGCLETDAPDVICQFIGIGLDGINAFFSVLTIDFGSVCGTDSITLQEEHHVLDVLLLLPTLGNLLHTFLADAGHFVEPFNIGFNHIDGFQSETTDDKLGEFRADAFHQSAAQVLLYAIDGGGHDLFPTLRYKLVAVSLIHFPIPFAQQNTPCRHFQQIADKGYKVIVSFDLDPHHRIPVFGILVGDSFYYTTELLHMLSTNSL